MVDRFSVSGQTGLIRQGDDVLDEWNRSLKGGKRWARAVREMRDTDATIGASILVSSAFLKQTPWFAQKAELPEGSPLEKQAEEAQQLLTEVMGDMSHTWTEQMSDMVSTMWFGYCPMEKVYKIRGGTQSKDPRRFSKFNDNKIGIRKISIRSQESQDGWKFDDEGNVLGMYQRAAPKFTRVFIESEKLVLFRTELNKNNPEGRSMLRNLYRSYYFLKRMQETEAIGTERELVGLPFGRLPIDHFGDDVDPKKAAVRDDFFQSLKHLRMNRLAAMVLPHGTDPVTDKPTGFDFGLLSSPGKRSLDIRAAIMDYKGDLARGMLTQFLFLGMASSGSFALSSDMTDVFSVALGALLDIFEDTFNRFCITELMMLNGFPPEVHPTWKHGDIEKENMKMFAEVMLGLITSGVITPDTKLEDFVRDKMELPARVEDEFEDRPTNIPDQQSKPEPKDDPEDDNPDVGAGEDG